MKTDVIGTLLAVDDEHEIRQLAAEFAEMWGFKVFLAANTNEALVILRTESPDVIVSDLVMPGQDGLAFLKQIREEGFKTPFLFLSAFMTKEHTTKSLNLGAIDFLPKPFTPRGLKLLLYEMLAISKSQQAVALPKNIQTTACQRIDISLQHFNDEMRIGKYQETLQVETIKSIRSSEMTSLFAAQSLELLTSAHELLMEIQRSDAPGRQISCLFRIMRALRLAASRLELQPIRDLAQAIEHNYIQLRVHLSYMNPMSVLTLSGAHDLLRRNIEAIQLETTLGYETKYTLNRETNLKIQELRSVIDS
jgi:DNA-binding response OmpR family regulator